MNKFKRHLLVYASLFIYFSLTIQAGYSQESTLHLYLDADLSHSVSSSRSIEQGILTSLSEINNQLQGHSIKLIKLDHRGNSRRSLNNLNTFLNDPHALAVFGGLHSPPLLANLKFINENGILHLIPWAAAGPITRYSKGKNWVFRLSIDDTKAGEVLVRHAVNRRHSKHPALLLEETGWGKSNAKTMKTALKKLKITPNGIFWFKWGTKESSARIILRKIIQSDADSILLVANAPEGKMFAKAMASLNKEERLPFCSHWGITGGDFPKVVTSQLRKKIELDFLQTSFSFFKKPIHPLGKKVLKQATLLFKGDIHSPEDIKAPTGFIHAYDLTRILIAAMKQVSLTSDMKTNRQNIRDALENIQKPVPGLIKTYIHPFTIFDSNHPDAHEALSANDFTMGRYDTNDRILLTP